jgi:diadenosine tetraphosphatase ApaH/serine/threonine PP2A family protein phosphatase
MRIALFADIHSNLEALNACLVHARSHGAERFAFLGDLVGYGPDPGPVVDRIAAMREEGAIVVKGNHDEAVDATRSYLNETAKEAIDWTREALDPAQRAFLRELPMEHREGTLLFVHASGNTPERWDYVDSAAAAEKSAAATPGATHTFVGHLHSQMLYAQIHKGRMNAFNPVPGTPIPVGRHRRWLAVVGTVGQPRDGKPLAGYAVFDTDQERLTFQRVAYDHPRTAEKIRAAGLPPALAWRIEKGT